MMPKPSFEFCAFKFLAQWQENECALHAAFSTTPTECDIRSALEHFRIARNFKKMDHRLAVILSCLNGVRNTQASSDPREKIKRLAQEFEKNFEKNNIAAASKFLWLCYRTPCIIYDSRADRALKSFSHKFKDYAQYADVWRTEYAKSEDAIRTAVEQLPHGRRFMRSCPLSDDALVQMAKEPWFMERVFDMFLWEIGEPIRKS